MKNGKRPTRKQKNFISSVRLNPANWLVTKNLPGCLHLAHKFSGKKRVLVLKVGNS